MSRIVQLICALATSFEFILATTLLAYFAFACPDRYPTVLWRSGGDWSSNPSFRTSLRVDYLEIQPMQLILDGKSIQYNLCVAIVTMVFWTVRLCIRGSTLDIYGVVVSNVLYDIILIALWSYSVVTQSPGDFSDPKHFYRQPWYLNHKHSEVWPQNLSTCEAAKASFGLTIFAVIWFGIRCLLTCMYGAYTYGRSLQETKFFRHSNEKVFV